MPPPGIISKRGAGGRSQPSSGPHHKFEPLDLTGTPSSRSDVTASPATAKPADAGQPLIHHPRPDGREEEEASSTHHDGLFGATEPATQPQPAGGAQGTGHASRSPTTSTTAPSTRHFASSAPPPPPSSSSSATAAASTHLHPPNSPQTMTTGATPSSAQFAAVFAAHHGHHHHLPYPHAHPTAVAGPASATTPEPQVHHHAPAPAGGLIPATSPPPAGSTANASGASGSPRAAAAAAAGHPASGGARGTGAAAAGGAGPRPANMAACAMRFGGPFGPKMPTFKGSKPTIPVGSPGGNNAAPCGPSAGPAGSSSSYHPDVGGGGASSSSSKSGVTLHPVGVLDETNKAKLNLHYYCAGGNEWSLVVEKLIRDKAKARKEREQLQLKCCHPNIVKYLFHKKRADSESVYMEFINLGSLRGILDAWDAAPPAPSTDELDSPTPLTEQQQQPHTSGSSRHSSTHHLHNPPSAPPLPPGLAGVTSNASFLSNTVCSENSATTTSNPDAASSTTNGLGGSGFPPLGTPNDPAGPMMGSPTVSSSFMQRSSSCCNDSGFVSPQTTAVLSTDDPAAAAAATAPQPAPPHHHHHHPPRAAHANSSSSRGGGCIGGDRYAPSSACGGAHRAPTVAERVLIARCIGRQVAQGLLYYHVVQGRYHRDIKPGNVLVKSDGRVKLCDFDAYKNAAESGITLDGTTCNLPPEMAQREAMVVDGKVDVWALGLVLYELVTGVHPFADIPVLRLVNTIPQIIKALPLEEKVPHKELRDIIRGCLTVEHGARLTCAQVDEHPFFTMRFSDLLAGVEGHERHRRELHEALHRTPGFDGVVKADAGAKTKMRDRGIEIDSTHELELTTWKVARARPTEEDHATARAHHQQLLAQHAAAGASAAASGGGGAPPPNSPPSAHELAGRVCREHLDNVMKRIIYERQDPERRVFQSLLERLGHKPKEYPRPNISKAARAAQHH